MPAVIPMSFRAASVSVSGSPAPRPAAWIIICDEPVSALDVFYSITGPEHSQGLAT